MIAQLAQDADSPERAHGPAQHALDLGRIKKTTVEMTLVGGQATKEYLRRMRTV